MITYDSGYACIKGVHEKDLKWNLYFDLSKGKYIQVLSPSQLGNLQKQEQFSLFCGVITVQKHYFLVFVEKVKLVGNIGNHPLFTIQTLEFFPFIQEAKSDYVES